MQTRAAIITHARKETFFLTAWNRHYRAIFGPENLFVVKDGDDWDLPEGLEDVNVLHTVFRRTRQHCDDDFAVYLTKKCAELLNDYDVVFRVDADEFLAVDPAKGDWETLFEEVRQSGYVYALGLDVVQNPDREGAYDFARPVLAQRRQAIVTGSYCKPCAIARPVT